jgi:hypothetical protein
MGFDNGEFYEKFLAPFNFPSDVTPLTDTLHVCVYLRLHVSFSVSNNTD